MPLSGYASKGAFRFLGRYVRRRFFSHFIVLAAVLAAVLCNVGSQYAVKHLVDVLSSHLPPPSVLWGAVGILLGLVAGDNILWRVAGWASTHAFVAVGGDIRIDLFDHLSGQGTRYFVEQFPGALAGRITVAANAAWLIENSLTWNTIPPGVAVIASILVLGTINWHLTAVLLAVVASSARSSPGWASHGRRAASEFRRPCRARERRSHRHREQHRPGARIRRRPARAAAPQRENSETRWRRRGRACVRSSGCGSSTPYRCSSSLPVYWCGRWSSGAEGR